MTILPTIQIIPDHLLEEYLKDKVTVKPNYGYDTEVSSRDALSRWLAAKTAETENREKRNKSTKGKYSL